MANFMIFDKRRPRLQNSCLLSIFCFCLGLNCASEKTREPHAGLSHDGSGTSTSLVQAFYIQVAAFQVRENAENLLSQLEDQFECSVASSDSSSGLRLHRVHVGPFSIESDAINALETLRDKGYAQAYLVKVEVPEARSSDSTNAAPDTANSFDLTTKQLTFTGGCSGPAWAPNGQEIAFYKKENNIQGIYTIGSGGGHISRIIENQGNERVTPQFAWSPNGNEIAVSIREVNQDWEFVESLFVVNKNGLGARRRLLQLENPNHEIRHLTWAPDQQYIAFAVLDQELSNRVVRIGFVGIQTSTDGRTTTREAGERLKYIATSVRTNDRVVPGNWLTKQKYLYLTVHDFQSRPEGSLSQELWSYDLTSDQKKLVWSRFGGGVISRLLLNSDTGQVVLQTEFGVSVVDGLSGVESAALVFDQDKDIKENLTVDYLNRIYVASGGKLWIVAPGGKKKQVENQIGVDYLTVNWTGTKLCYSQAGNLFSARLRH